MPPRQATFDDVGRIYINQNVQFFIRSNTDILDVAMFKYSLHKFRETTMVKIPVNLNMNPIIVHISVKIDSRR